jgi:hypothetical protein
VGRAGVLGGIGGQLRLVLPRKLGLQVVEEATPSHAVQSGSTAATAPGIHSPCQNAAKRLK